VGAGRAALGFYALASRRSRRLAVDARLRDRVVSFFPNAPYIVTDIVHLRERPPAPYWYDIIAIMAFAQTGLFLGYLSLYLMQEVIRAWLGALDRLGLRACHAGLSSFGFISGVPPLELVDALLDPLDTLRNARARGRIRGTIRPARFFGDVFRLRARLLPHRVLLHASHGLGHARRTDSAAGVMPIRGAAFAGNDSKVFTLWDSFAHSSGSPFFSGATSRSQCFSNMPDEFFRKREEGIRDDLEALREQDREEEGR